MTLESLTPLQRRGLALSILAMALLFVQLGLVLPLIHQYSANQDKIWRLNKQLQRYKQNVSERGAVMEQTATIKNSIIESGIFSTQKSISLLMAELQENVKHIVSAAGGELSSTQNLNQITHNGLIKLGISASFSGKMDNLKQILYELESAKPYLIIQHIKISAAESHRNIATGKLDSSNNINVLADIVSYIPSEPS